MEYGKIKVIHCDFEQSAINKIISKEIPFYYHTVELIFRVSETNEKDGKYGMLATCKFRPYATKSEDSLFGSYITEQWFYIKFPNNNDVQLMKDLREICVHAYSFSEDKFSNLKVERNYPFGVWEYPLPGVIEVDNMLKSLRDAQSQQRK